MLDRLLLAERERACDDDVIRLGGAADVYASSLVKVLRFCLGWNVAGASHATGSSLGRRIERIMSTNVQVKLSVWHRVAIGSIAALVIVLSMAAGLITREGASAQSAKPREGPAGGVPGGVSGGVAAGVPGGVIGGVTGYVDSLEQEKLVEKLAQAREVAVEFTNSADAPVVITEAKVKAVPREEGRGDEFAVVPVVTLSNNTDRRIRGVTLEFRIESERRAYYERALIDPHAVYTSGAQKRLTILVGRPEAWSVRVSGVVFDDGEVWGVVPPPPPPPPPPADWKMLEWGPETAARFNNREGDPLSITGAILKAARLERSQQAAIDSDTERYMIALVVSLANNTARRIVGIGIEFGSPDSNDGLRSYASATIDPHATYKFETPPAGRPGRGTFFVRGNPDSKEVRVIGVKFEDGDVWGSFPPPPPRPPAPSQELPSPDGKMIRKAGDVMAASATHRVVPESPPLARAAKINGSVVVEVTLDEEGAVTAARAISGHPLLKDAAINAARQWRFNPTLLSGVPVKVIGTLTFHFEP
jgi:TonB family protein